MNVFIELNCDLTSPALGTAMGNVGHAYDLVGRHQDALVFLEKTLDFLRRVLPHNHPHLGSACTNLSINLCQARDFHRAIERAREALSIYKATLPPSHPNIQKAQQLVRLIEGDLVRRA